MSIDPRHLLALVDNEALLRECARRGLAAPPQDDAAIEVGGLRVSPLAMEAAWRGRRVSLGWREAQVLYALVLARRQGLAWLRSDRLAVKVWRVSDHHTLACLHMTTHRLRTKLPGLIVSKPGNGGAGRYGLALDAQEQAA